MKRSTLISAVLFTGLFSFNAAGQTKTKTNSQPTVLNQPVAKIDKKIAGVDSSIGKAMATASRAKDVAKEATVMAKDFIAIFGSKTPNEGAIVIPAIEFDDANLATLIAAVKDRKEIKKATVEYTDGTATIKMTFRGKSQADFWLELPKELREAFKMKSKHQNNILVEYKAATANKDQLVQN